MIIFNYKPKENNMTIEDEQKAFKASPERTLVSISADLHKRLKVLSAEMQTSIYMLADEAIANYLEKQ